jgi:hypothetical protein
VDEEERERHPDRREAAEEEGRREEEAGGVEAGPQVSGDETERSVVDRTATEVRQAAVRKKGGRAAIAVEYGTVRGRANR